MDFEENEIAIVNEKFKNAMPYRSGERCKILRKLHNSLHFSYEVEFDDGVKCKAKESELNKLNEEDKQYMEYIYTGNKVAYRPIDEVVAIIKIDYLHKVAEIECDQDVQQVVGFESLKPLENKEQQNKRISWDKYFMDIASTVATRATCDRLHVGCVIVKDKKIISTGYNGSVSGQPHCDEIGHLYNEQGRCVRTIHAEQNAILCANRDDLNDSTAYVTHQPCENCAKLLIQSGVERLVYKNKYTNTYSDFFLNMIKSSCSEEE